MKVDVTIVGAGPGGMMLGYLLARANYSVLVIEKTKKLGQAFRGEHLNQEGEQVLKQAGLYNHIESAGLLKMESLEYYNEGRKIKTILPDKEVGHLGIHVPQKHLLEAIYHEALCYPNFSCVFGINVKNFYKDHTGVYTTIETTNEDIPFIYSRIIIGADGRHSTVRKKIDIPIEIRSHGYDILWARIPAPDNWQPSIKMALIDGMQLSVFTQYNGFIQIGWNIPKGSFSELRKTDFHPFIQKLIESFPILKDTVEENIKSWSDFVPLDVFSSQTSSWSKDNVIMIGDAVHAFTPTGAFGLNSALKDAEVVANLLIKNGLQLRNWSTCEEQRKKVVGEIQQKQRDMEENFSLHFKEVTT